MIEVEARFRLAAAAELERRLCSDWSAQFAGEVFQQDDYFAHPLRDFRLTDEALRVRTVTTAAGDVSRQLGYKGPGQDAVVAARRELECGLVVTPNAVADTVPHQILQVLGFTPAGGVRKIRRLFHLVFQQRAIAVAVDQVQELGAYAELEIVCPEADRPSAADCILRLAAALQLQHAEPRSYLEILQNQG